MIPGRSVAAGSPVGRIPARLTGLSPSPPPARSQPLPTAAGGEGEKKIDAGQSTDVSPAGGNDYAAAERRQDEIG